MASLNIKIDENRATRKAKICVTFTHDVNIITIVDTLRQMFELEMYRAKVVTDHSSTSITIESQNEEMVKHFRKGLMKIFATHHQQNQN